VEPPIRFSQTSDGVDIAYWTMGEGTPLIAMPSMPWSHLQLEWSIPEVTNWYETLGHGRTLVRYDGRGFGLSTRQVDEMSLEAEVLDLEAVVAGSGLDRFDLYAGLHSGPPAITYAARHPERVDHLVLFCSYADGAEFAESPLTQATRPIINHSWDFYSEAVARLLLGWSENEAAERFAALVHECTDPDMAYRSLMATTSYDVTSLLASVETPALVLQRRELVVSGSQSASMERARVLAAGIPGARLSVMEGTSVAPYLGDAAQVVREINEFLGADPIDDPAPDDAGASALRTILFTDVEGSTTLTQQLGDEAARAVMREHEQIVRRELGRHGGTEVKTMGDGFMASFGSAIGAVECAIDLQRRFADYNESAGHPVRIRVGINAGEPIAEDGDLHGTAVIAAARIGAHADGGEVYVSDVVRQLVAGKGFDFVHRGEVELRGFDDPQNLYEVLWAYPG
jgi:class 3 adenylate cyclase/pimeloyl-ACP methyl ester carboxylesterase